MAAAAAAAAFNIQIATVTAQSGPIANGALASLATLNALGYDLWQFNHFGLPESQQHVAQLRAAIRTVDFALTQLQALNDQLIAYGNRGGISVAQAQAIQAVEQNPTGLQNFAPQHSVHSRLFAAHAAVGAAQAKLAEGEARVLFLQNALPAPPVQPIIQQVAAPAPAAVANLLPVTLPKFSGIKNKAPMFRTWRPMFQSMVVDHPTWDWAMKMHHLRLYLDGPAFAKVDYQPFDQAGFQRSVTLLDECYGQDMPLLEDL
jgi:hypothetical protein